MRLSGALSLAFFALACTPRPEEQAKLEDGVVVPAVYRCKKVGSDTDCHLELKTQPALDIPVPPCERAELAEDASGKAIAHRCGPGKPWSVVRLRRANRYLADCNAPLGSGPKPEWSKLGAVEPRAMQILDCESGSARAWGELAQAIAEDSGPELAAKFVVASTLRPTRPGTDEDGWVRAFDELPPPAQELVRKETCPALQKASASSLLYVRAARRCPLDAPNVAEIGLQAYQNHMNASRREFAGSDTDRVGASVAPRNLNNAELALVMEAFVALKQRPKEAAATACDRIAVFSREYDPVRVVVAASVLSLTKTRCPALDKKSDLWPCDLVAPQKSKISERVAQFGAPPAGAMPVLVSPSEAVFDAVTIDGKYPPGWSCP